MAGTTMSAARPLPVGQWGWGLDLLRLGAVEVLPQQSLTTIRWERGLAGLWGPRARVPAWHSPATVHARPPVPSQGPQQESPREVTGTALGKGHPGWGARLCTLTPPPQVLHPANTIPPHTPPPPPRTL